MFGQICNGIVPPKATPNSSSPRCQYVSKALSQSPNTKHPKKTSFQPIASYRASLLLAFPKPKETIQFSSQDPWQSQRPNITRSLCKPRKKREKLPFQRLKKKNFLAKKIPQKLPRKPKTFTQNPQKLTTKNHRPKPNSPTY